MRKLFPILALAALAACSERPTQPTNDGPQFASQGAPHGAWVVRYSAADNWCSFWDASGNFDLPMVPCQWNYTPGPKGTFHMRIWTTGTVPNATGRAVHFGPTSYPQGLADAYLYWYGVYPVGGLMPLCDFNTLRDPTYSTLICSTNWHYTISASGKATLQFEADPGHSYQWPPAP